jgi:hypothetical protein
MCWCLRPFIWSSVSALMRFRDGSDKFCVHLGKSATQAIIAQVLEKESVIHTRKVQIHRERERWDRWKAKLGACSSFALTSRELFTKNSSWQTKLSIPHTTVTFYGDNVKLCEDFSPNFGGERTDCCITTTCRLTYPFSPGIFDLKQHDSLTQRLDSSMGSQLWTTF